MGVQTTTGGGGRTAPELTHRVVTPRHWSAATPATYRTGTSGFRWVPSVELGGFAWQHESPFWWLAQHGFGRVEESLSFPLDLRQQCGQVLSSACSFCGAVRHPSEVGRSAEAGGSTPLALAHAHRSSTLKQQQCRQQSSALWHPQGWFSQGYRWLRSLTASAGSGKPNVAIK